MDKNNGKLKILYTCVVVSVVVVNCCGAGQQQSFQAFDERRSNQQTQSGGNMFYCMADGIEQGVEILGDWPVYCGGQG